VRRREPHPDLPTEQAYIDHAYECLEQMRVRVERAREAGEGEFAQAVLDAWAAGTLESYAEAERGICFGRLDVEMAEAPLSIARPRSPTVPAARSRAFCACDPTS
jgi:hypothetical protein